MLGYVSKINSEEYNENKDNGYTYNSNIGKMGLEVTLEKYLKGTDGIKVKTSELKEKIIELIILYQIF